jgi:hypothetical protein
MSPAYSADSNIVCNGFDGNVALATDGALIARRIAGEQDGKEATSFNLTAAGGAAWCPDNNKFYQGVTTMGPSSDAACVVIDPNLEFSFELITGFTGNKIGIRALYHATTGEIWLSYNTGGNGFARIDPSDNSIAGYVSCPVPSDFCYCSANSKIYFCTSATVYEVTGAGAATLLWSASTVSGSAQIRAIDYVSGVGVVFLVQDAGAGYFFAWVLDIGTNTATPYASGVGGSFMYYSSTFSKIVLQGNGGVLVTYDPDFTGIFVTGTDQMCAAKGCYVSSLNKEALPVLTGPGGGRYYSVNYFTAAELGV